LSRNLIVNGIDEQPREQSYAIVDSTKHDFSLCSKNEGKPIKNPTVMAGLKIIINSKKH